jgi:hypothetical protein
MPETSALDLLAEEAGIVVARIERECNLRIANAVSEMARQRVEFELRMMQMEKRIDDRIAALRDGRDGKDGADGINGRNGVDGAAGRDGSNGADGRDGVDGLDGQDGQDGKDGKDGRDGVDGKDGIDGKDGTNGKEGPPGRAGEPGQRGLDGADGFDGKDGEPGPRGLPGPPGKLPPVRRWVEGSVCYESDVVIHLGGTYQAVRDTAKPPGEHIDWLCVSAPGRDGRDGIDGRSFTLRGIFDGNAEYKFLDVVTLNSSWFVATCDDPGPCPGSNWRVGPTGKRGDKGERGQRGDKGDKGDPGLSAPQIIKWITENYSLIPIYSDGSRGPAIVVRSLFEQFQREAL